MTVRVIESTLLVVLIATGGCSSQITTSERENNSAEGEKLFVSKCASCHRLPKIQELPFDQTAWGRLIDDHRRNNGLAKVVTLEQSNAILRYIDTVVEERNKE
jgi:mono/diheme cytochrome c family protein